MPENDKDNKDFEFIKEQVIEKKHKKHKKWQVPLLMMIFMAVLFGLIAAVTFCVAEPKLYMILHKEEENKTPISFPTNFPDDPDNIDNEKDPDALTEEDENAVNPQNGEEVPSEQEVQKPETVIIENKIDANMDDYLNMYEEIKTMVYETSKSIVTVSSISSKEDWYGYPVDLQKDTTGVVIFNNNVDLLILVSWDRVKDANAIKIKLSDTVAIDAEILDYESDINLALIAVPLKEIPEMYKNSITVAAIGESYTIAVGNPVIALGSPNGYPNSMDMGIVTSKGSFISITDNKLDLFNTNMKDNLNSDGIIVNMKGEIIGLITRTLKEDKNEELTTAIGISKVKQIISRLANKEPRIYFGVKTEDLTLAATKEHNVESGIYVNEVLANSPAFAAGMKNGDIILQINDLAVLNTNSFYSTISSFQPEEKINVKIKRTSATSEKEMDLEIVLLEKESN